MSLALENKSLLQKNKMDILLHSLVHTEISSEWNLETIQYFPNRVTTDFIYKQSNLFGGEVMKTLLIVILSGFLFGGWTNKNVEEYYFIYVI